MPFNCGKLAGTSEMDMIFMFMKKWSDWVACSCTVAKYIFQTAPLKRLGQSKKAIFHVKFPGD